MVPLQEMSPERDSVKDSGGKQMLAGEVRGTTGAASKGAAAPIAELYKLAMKDAILELEAKVRSVQDFSLSAVLQARQTAAQHLDMEVNIEDPALRGLFDLHVVAVEELFARVRSHAEATLAASDAWSQPPLQSVACEFKLLSMPQAHGITALADELSEAEGSTAGARERLASRIKAEVYGTIDDRCKIHDYLRAAVRERQRWGNDAAAARRDVVRLRKASSGESGLLALSGDSSAAPLAQAQGRMHQATSSMAKADERLLTSFVELGTASVDAVRRPWAALMQIQAEYYTSQQSIWAPLAQSFEEFSARPEVTTR